MKYIPVPVDMSQFGSVLCSPPKAVLYNRDNLEVDTLKASNIMSEVMPNLLKQLSDDINCSSNVPSSPLPKRSSWDFADMLVSAGLPTDLNRLTKEQLLKELQLRGNSTATIKSLKKELVDTLKDTIIAQSSASVAEEVQYKPSTLTESSKVVSTSSYNPTVTVTNTTPPKAEPNNKINKRYE
jgi:hypothetical protein